MGWSSLNGGHGKGGLERLLDCLLEVKADHIVQLVDVGSQRAGSVQV